ncbi:MAG: hypothetical protein WAS21_14930 [Geminicoccaceae bacterium]
MRPAHDDEFKLRFPVVKDRTLRRIAIVQLSIYVSAISSVAVIIVSSFFIDGLKENPGGTLRGINNAADAIAILAILIFIGAFPASWIVAIIEARVQVRRYGWRAVKDPIEVQRVAMREALYDVATGSARSEVEPERKDDRIMIVPVRRLRPVGARLELIAERQRAQEPRQGS